MFPLKNLLSPMFLAMPILVFALPALADFEENNEVKPLQEIAVQLPAAPLKESFTPFFVSAATANHFYIDGASLSVGEDGVVRFVLIVEAAGGARNVSFEGMRCLTRERRIYATGRLDGSWSKSRNNDWVPIKDAATNRQYAALFLDYFCPDGIVVRNAKEALDALRQGYHPDIKR